MSRKTKLKKGIAIGLLFAGIAVCAIPIFVEKQNKDRTEGYIREFEQEEEDENTEIDKKKNAKEKKEGVIGIVEIPSLDLKYPIFEGATSKELAEGIGHLPETTGLCEKGNCVLAGHNGSSRGTYFTYLSNIQIGDHVTVTNQRKIMHKYKVKEYRVVQPYDAWVTAYSEKEMLTLFTCSEHGTKRFVVKCEPVEDYFGGGGYAKEVQVD